VPGRELGDAGADDPAADDEEIEASSANLLEVDCPSFAGFHAKYLRTVQMLYTHLRKWPRTL
jgi:hypothetical protein